MIVLFFSYPYVILNQNLKILFSDWSAIDNWIDELCHQNENCNQQYLENAATAAFYPNSSCRA